jgi:hypothetical protein
LFSDSSCRKGLAKRQNAVCPGLSGTIGSLLDVGTYKLKTVNMPIDAFLNINEGLQGDEGVVDEDGDVVDPFGGNILTGGFST